MTTHELPIHGTVYGVLLNSNAEWQSASAHMNEAPYKAPPVAPVLYVKTANTWSINGSNIPVPADVPEVEIGATLGVVLGLPNAAGAPHLRGFVLLNDVSIPHSVDAQGFYRPPVKYKCLDGFLGVGPNLVPASDVAHPNALQLEVRINGVVRQTVHLADMRRLLPDLLADVNDFMTLQAGDVLMLGLGICQDGPEAGHRPRARVGDVIDIQALNLPSLGVLRHTLVAAPALEMPV
ncbi:MhpD 2-keto-4-pentenoate hydratase/2-oxohepta-3-ene-1,7-dioic acid hydratase (catechol pathway) [Burkholderiaceae bacterium]